jgi:hypothetical protein
MTVWSKEVDTILPLADRMYFYERENEPLRVTLWADAIRVMASAMQPVVGLPPRCRVNSFPSAEQMVAMGARIR